MNESFKTRLKKMLSRSSYKKITWQASVLHGSALFCGARQNRFLTKPEFKDMRGEGYAERRNSLFRK